MSYSRISDEDLEMILFPASASNTADRAALNALRPSGPQDELVTDMLNQTRDALVQEVREYRASHGLRFDVDDPFYARATGERIHPAGDRAREDAQDAFVMARELTVLSAENQLVWLERFRRLGARRDFFIRAQWLRLTDRAQTAAETRAGGDRVRAIGDVLIGPIDSRRRRPRVNGHAPDAQQGAAEDNIGNNTHPGPPGLHRDQTDRTGDRLNNLNGAGATEPQANGQTGGLRIAGLDNLAEEQLRQVRDQNRQLAARLYRVGAAVAGAPGQGLRPEVPQQPERDAREPPAPANQATDQAGALTYEDAERLGTDSRGPRLPAVEEEEEEDDGERGSEQR